jgi:hypothetical protein
MQDFSRTQAAVAMSADYSALSMIPSEPTKRCGARLKVHTWMRNSFNKYC